MCESTMSVIIRLQNLPWSANALDVRGYFLGLSIPDGGVHIVGGENGDAFIAFSTDEDARQAMMLDGGKIKEVQVHLLLSSRAEMQKVIETARQTTISYMQIPITQVQSQSLQQTAPIQSQNSTISPSLSGILSQQMLQQQKIITDLTANLPKISTLPHHIIINDNSSDSKDSRDRDSSSKDLYDSRMDRDKKRDNDKRDRDRDRDRDRKLSRSRSRSSSRTRDRRRSRSYDRTGRNNRRRRSRSRDRTDRRYKRNRRSKSRDRSRDRERDRERKPSKDTIINLTNRSESPNAGSLSIKSIWDIGSSNTSTNNPILNSAASPVNIYDSNVTVPPPVTIKRMYSTDELNKLHQLDKMRNSSAFQTAQEPLYPINMQYDRKPTPIPTPLIPLQNLPHFLNTSQPPPPIISHSIDDKCIKLSNMHLITGYGEIRRFFHRLQINQNGIKMINDSYGRRTGTALVRFIKSESKKLALIKSDLILRGEIVKITDIPDQDFDDAIDSFKPANHNSNHNYHYESDNDSNTADDDDDVQIISDDNIVKPYVEPLPFQILMVDEIPPFTKEHDILKMFSNYSLMHIVLGKSKSGSKPLQGFVKFHRPDDAKAALHDKSLHFIAHKSVVVSICPNELYEAAKNEFSSDSEYIDNAIKSSPITNNTNFPSDPRQNKRNYLSGENSNSVSNKDYNSDSNENKNWDNQIYNSNSHINNNNNNNNNNNSTNESNESNSSRNNSLDPRINHNRQNDFRNNRGNNDNNSFQTNNNWSNDSNYQNNFLAREQASLNMNNLNESQNAHPNWSKDPRFRGGSNQNQNQNQNDLMKTDCVAISNLELKTTDRDVIDFFSDIGLIPLRVHILLTPQGGVSGDCFCEFASPEDAARAVTKNQTHLGSNTVCVEYIPRQKVEEILLSFKNSQSRSGHHNNGGDDQQNGNYRSGNRGGDYRNNNGNNYNPHQINISNNHNNHMGRGPPPININMNVRPLLGNNYPDMNQNLNPMMCGGGDGVSMAPQPVVGEFGGPGCVLSLENVPYRAGVDDILDFFSDFDLSKEHVMRRYNNSGAPTGDARVCFVSPDEAQRALNTKRLGKIANRTIYLNILQDL